ARRPRLPSRRTVRSAAPRPGRRLVSGRPNLRPTTLSSLHTRCIPCAMSVPLALLGLLEREPRHGYDLKRDYDTFFGRGKPLPFGQVYATLGRLARDGKVVVSEVGPGVGPDRKRYVITELGATEVGHWLTEA